MNRPLILNHWSCNYKWCGIKKRAVELVVGFVVVLLILFGLLIRIFL